MKAKKGFSALDSFPLSRSSGNGGVVSVAGNDARMRRISELFESGSEEEARDLLRQALYEATHNLDNMRAEEREVAPRPALGVLLEREGY